MLLIDTVQDEYLLNRGLEILQLKKEWILGMHRSIDRASLKTVYDLYCCKNFSDGRAYEVYDEENDVLFRSPGWYI